MEGFGRVCVENAVSFIDFVNNITAQCCLRASKPQNSFFQLNPVLFGSDKVLVYDSVLLLTKMDKVVYTGNCSVLPKLCPGFPRAGEKNLKC